MSVQMYNKNRDALMHKLRERESQIRSTTLTMNQLYPLGGRKFDLANSDKVHFTEDALKQLYYGFGGIPMPYYDRLKPRRQIQTIQNHIEDLYEDLKPGDKEPSVSLTILGDKVVGIPNEKKPFIGLTGVVRALESGIGKGVNLERWKLADNGLTVSYTTPRVQVEPRVGDLVNGGIELHYSDTYLNNPEMHYFAWRLACTNGMVLPVDGQRIKIVGETMDDILGSIEAEAQRLMGQVQDQLLTPFAETANHPVEDIGSFVNELAKDMGLHKRIRDRLMKRALTELLPPVSSYDIINLLTSLQHDETLPENDRYSVQVSGAIEAHDHATRCSRCHHIIT